MSDKEYNPNSVDAVLSRIEAHQISNGEKLDRVIESQSEHDKRISDLEGSRKKLYGVAAGVSLAFGGAAEWIKHTFGK